MVKAILIIGFRADVGAYVIDSYPEFDVDDVDVMNIYNLHRFRTTERNFQIIKQGGMNIASYYSGFKNTNYIGAPDHCITLILEENDNPNDYEKVLIKVTNNLLTQLGKDDFDFTLRDIFLKLDEKEFDEIKVSRDIKFEEEQVKKVKIATTSSATLSEEEKIFQDLLDSSELGVADKEFDNKLSDFEKSTISGDPFGGASADPFGGAGSAKDSRDIYAENPFDEAIKPSFEKAVGLDEAIGKTMFEKTKTTAAEIIKNLDRLENQKPIKPSDASKEAKFKYLEDLVGFLSEKVKILGSLANHVKELEKSHEEKDKLIGKLLLLLKEK
ncbi:MAG: hypothetical protein ACTSQJ_00745 [Promethearchaeota archaeon]